MIIPDAKSQCRTTSEQPSVSLIVPVHDTWQSRELSLESIVRLEAAAAELILVSDGAMSDPPPELAARFRVFSTGSETCKGPATARNLGARHAHGDILLFVDSDVVVPADLIWQIVAAFRDHPDAAALFGSYDDDAGAPNFLSQYKNLLHHFTHQHSRPDASTFWTGCGAIRADVFRALHGFAEERDLLEDVELGARLAKAGHETRLVRSVQVKHLKRYSAVSLLKSDISRRAVPWSRLIISSGSLQNELNLARNQRVSAALVAMLVLTAPIAIFDLRASALSACAASAVAFINRAFYLFLAARRGWPFALGSVFWHWLYFLYAAATFGFVLIEDFILRRRLRRPKRATLLQRGAIPTT
ncbi:MAG: glycosyltransferase [Chthoniobacterales bacterium]